MESTIEGAAMPNAVILQSEGLHEYILDTAVYPREAEPLKELRKATASHPTAFIGSSPDAGQLMAMLIKLVHAKKTIEVGVFTGYSLLLTALAIPDDGHKENEGRFDFAFVDADKENYLGYHERLMKLVKFYKIKMAATSAESSAENSAETETLAAAVTLGKSKGN
ncbi:hypothetical protein CRG98_029611 [Punica granatum]|uniref:Uncharacterized protein n=1 Tax=Punica granatum TaxID=22663 RepID=A0A2I0J258_PUNGR|nr:hypothetical protein CRG98_029611 [Punica granatum]